MIIRGRFALLTLVLVLTACAYLGIAPARGKPTIYLTAPPHGSEFRAGDNVLVQSVSNDPAGIARVELLIDGALARSDAAPSAQTYFNLAQYWTATPGTHTIAVRAYNTRGSVSEAAAVTVSVLAPGTVSATPVVAPIAQPTLPAPPTLWQATAPAETAAVAPARGTVPAALQEKSKYEGTIAYQCDARGCWRMDGKLTSQPEYFFPELNADNSDIRALLASIGLPSTRPGDDREKWARTRMVWAWLNKNILNQKHPNYAAAWEDLQMIARDRWPGIGDMAQIFKRHGGLVWGACNSRALTLATLLYRVGIAPDDLAVVTTMWKQEYSQHLYVMLRVDDGWYYIDPTCNEGHPALSAAPERVGCNTADYAHPNTINALPGSTLGKPMLAR